MLKKWLAAAMAAVLAFSLSGAYAVEKTVVTSFYPIYILAKNLTYNIEGLTLKNLAAPETGCLHDYQLLTGDMRTLSGAKVLLINGAGMESYLDTVIAQFPEMAIVDASNHVPLMENDGGDEHLHENESETQDHAHEDNAHIWLSVSNAILMVSNLRDGLMAAYPEYTELLTTNTDAYIARLTALDEELKTGLASLAGKEIITFHEAFPYFAKAYGLNVAAVVVREPGEALSPAQLAELVKTVRGLGVPPLFTEPQYPDLAARTLAAETGAKVYTLDPLVTGPMDEGALTAYEEGMRKNLQTLQLALGGN